jgi:starvation-inducible DNA-binding protein
MILQQALKNCLADSFAFYLKSQFYHWNVGGQDFFQYHELFGKIYEEVQSAVDTIAELIRQLDEVTPGSLGRFKELTKIQDAEAVPDIRTMVVVLEQDNRTVLASLLTAYQIAEEQGEIGISNILQDRLSAHEKHGWFLRASAK